MPSSSSMEIELLVGASPYAIDRTQAQWLARRIRATCLDSSHRPLDAQARACLQLADVLAEDLTRGSSPEPVELGLSHARGLTAHVLGSGAAQEHDLVELYEALLRLRSTRPPRLSFSRVR
jgi:hypothetical protein